MTREELKTLFREKALPAYEKALEDISGLSVGGAINYLRKKDMQDGICHYLSEKTGRFFYFRKMRGLMEKNVFEPGSYVAEIPTCCYTEDEVVKTLQSRIKFMRSVLNDELWKG